MTEMGNTKVNKIFNRWNLCTFFNIDPCSVSSSKPLTILPTLGLEFKLSFEVYFNTFNVSSDYSEIFCLTPKNICYSNHSGIDNSKTWPVVYSVRQLYAVDEGLLRVLTQTNYVGRPRFYYYPTNLPAQKWISIEISQFPMKIGSLESLDFTSQFPKYAIGGKVKLPTYICSLLDSKTYFVFNATLGFLFSMLWLWNF